MLFDFLNIMACFLDLDAMVSVPINQEKMISYYKNNKYEFVLTVRV